jgi:hypothetical protein
MMRQQGRQDSLQRRLQQAPVLGSFIVGSLQGVSFKSFGENSMVEPFSRFWFFHCQIAQKMQA